MSLAGTKQRILLAQYDLSSFCVDAKLSESVGLERSETFGDSAEEFTPTLTGGSLSFTVLSDSAAGAPNKVLPAFKGSTAGECVSYFEDGYNDIGDPVTTFIGREQSLEQGGAVAGLINYAATIPINGKCDHGVVLHAHAAETGTTASSSVDNAASSANGGVAQQHTTAFSGTSCTPKVQHSTDNSVWVDLVSFAAISAVGSERVEVAAGTTVNRYLRETRTGTFTSITFSASFARRA
jgi:hypothetical protein